MHCFSNDKLFMGKCTHAKVAISLHYRISKYNNLFVTQMLVFIDFRKNFA